MVAEEADNNPNCSGWVEVNSDEVVAGYVVVSLKNTVKVEVSDAKRLLALVEALEESDDVAKVSSNFDIDAEALAAIDG